MLEGLKLEPGDVVSYYARATDNNGVSGPQKAATDIYFLTVRPYENDYRQRQGGGGGGGGGGQPDDAGQLSQKQREIIAATFKTARDSARTDKKTLDENLATLRLSQQRLREQTSQLANRLVERGISTSDTNWKKIAEILPKAAAHMDTAEKTLTQGSPQSALGSEQRALQQLQRAEAVFREIQVSMGQGGGAGVVVASKPTPRISPTSSSCRRIKLRNQYETVQRGQAAEPAAAAGGQPGRRNRREVEAARGAPAAGERSCATQSRQPEPDGRVRRVWRPGSARHRAAGRRAGAPARASRARAAVAERSPMPRGDCRTRRSHAPGRGERSEGGRRRVTGAEQSAGCATPARSGEEWSIGSAT